MQLSPGAVIFAEPASLLHGGMQLQMLFLILSQELKKQITKDLSALLTRFFRAGIPSLADALLWKTVGNVDRTCTRKFDKA